MLQLLTVCLGLAQEDGACSGVVRWVRLQGQFWGNKKHTEVFYWDNLSTKGTLWAAQLSLLSSGETKGENRKPLADTLIKLTNYIVYYNTHSVILLIIVIHYK